MSIKAFINGIQQAEMQQEVYFDRFQEDGKKVPFVIKRISAGVEQKLQKRCIIQKVNPVTKKVDVSFENAIYNLLLCGECVVSPDLNDPDLKGALDLSDVNTPGDVLAKLLTPGEFTKLLKEVQIINGLMSLDEKVDEAKNSSEETGKAE